MDRTQLDTELANARLAVNDWHVCATAEELERWRQAQERLIAAAQAVEAGRCPHHSDVSGGSFSLHDPVVFGEQPR